MKGIRLCCFLIAMQVLISGVCVTSRPLTPNDDHGGVHEYQPGQESLQATLRSKESDKSMEGEGKMNEEAYNEGVSKIGSRPPSCEHKCFGCIPCEAIQVPTNTAHVGVQYANYEPEGWKCKCGLSFYTP